MKPGDLVTLRWLIGTPTGLEFNLHVERCFGIGLVIHVSDQTPDTSVMWSGPEPDHWITQLPRDLLRIVDT